MPGPPPNARLSVQARDAEGTVYPGLNADHELAGLDAFVRGGGGHEESSVLFRFGPELPLPASRGCP